MKELIKKLSHIQRNLNAPKNQWNSFRNFAFRSCEDILEGLKPHLDDETIVTLSDEVQFVEGRHYMKSTATFYHKDKQLSVSSPAREILNKTGFDEPQCSGTASSYARKYALNGLFLIDDQKDPDTDEYQKTQQGQKGNKKQNNNKQSNNKQHNKNQDWATKKLRDLIFSLTKSFKDKTQVQIICQMLKIKDLSQIAEFDQKWKKDTIDFLNKKFQTNSSKKN